MKDDRQDLLRKMILSAFDLLPHEDQEQYLEDVRELLLRNSAKNEWATEWQQNRTVIARSRFIQSPGYFSSIVSDYVVLINITKSIMWSITQTTVQNNYLIHIQAARELFYTYDFKSYFL